jgi:hypothetical protein
MADKKRQSPHFFMREGDGSVRLRIRLSPEEASRIEEAAGTTPLLSWIHQTLQDAARRQVQSERDQRPPVGPPDTEETPS